MVNRALLEALELLTPEEQDAILAVAGYLKDQRVNGTDPSRVTAALLEQVPAGEPAFANPDEGLSPARLAARRFMRENPALMRLLAQ